MPNKELWEIAKATAKTVNIVDFERAVHGVEFVRFSGREYMHPEFDSLKVREYLWKRHSGLTGKLGQFTSGNAVTYVMEYYNVNFRTAVLELVKYADPDLYEKVSGDPVGEKKEQPKQFRSVSEILEKARAEMEDEEKKKLTLPEAFKNNDELKDYLCNKRGIHPALVYYCIEKGLLYQTKFRQCCFISHDENNHPAYAFCRGIHDTSKHEVSGSNKKYSFKLTLDPESTSVFVFEAAIDLLSFISYNMMHGTNTDLTKGRYLSLGGVDDGALAKYLSVNSNITDIIFCLDDDKPGHDAVERLQKKYAAECNVSERQIPVVGVKDWNEALLATIAASKK